jgi:PAS domain S-box-containing protein
MPNERTLQISELRYRRVFEAAKDGILILNADTGAVEDANPFMTELLGYTHDQFLGKHLWEIGLFSDLEQNGDSGFWVDGITGLTGALPQPPGFCEA